jgi:release factor glutamine methyltransferase
VTTTLANQMSPAQKPSGFDQHLRDFSAGFAALPDKPRETAEATLRTLWHLATGDALSLEAAQEIALPELDATALERLRDLITQRKAGQPLAHLTGRQRFMGLELLAGPQALIPRAETELLGNAALSALQRYAQDAHVVQVLDVCTGSGNLALALAHHEPKARVFATDLSGEAVALAMRTCTHLGLDDRVQWRVGDLLEPFNEAQFHGAFDLITCNPPYISSPKVSQMAAEISRHEPEMAFDGGPLGIRILQRLIKETPRYLKPNGTLAFEVGLGQGQAVIKRMMAQGHFMNVQTVLDAEGQIRAIIASA